MAAHFNLLFALTKKIKPKASNMRSNFHINRNESMNFSYNDTSVETMAEAVIFMLKRLKTEKPELLKKIRPVLMQPTLTMPAKKLSPVLVNKHYRIYLPGYGNREVKLHALSRAVYILFLHHPRGIRFKELYKHKDELLSIYNKVTNRYCNEQIHQAIDDLVDMTNPSINQKCARIRQAFREIMDEHIAKYYYIDGPNGEPKKIMLPEELIQMEF